MSQGLPKAIGAVTKNARLVTIHPSVKEDFYTHAEMVGIRGLNIRTVGIGHDDRFAQ